MLSIGEFSKICRCTSKTLRHYDSIGLLKPVSYNPKTGYRYYETSQLFRMLFIQKLKGYGFSLIEIKKLFGSDKNDLIAVLNRKYTQLSARMEMQKTLLTQMKNDIWNLKKGMDFMETKNMEINLVQIPDLNILSLRENISMKNFGRLLVKVMELLEQTGAECLGAPVAIYHSQEFDPAGTDLEIGVPTNASVSNTRVLQGGTCAMAVHKGSYASLPHSYALLAEWIESKDFSLSAPAYEKYLNSPEDVPEDQLVTEIYFPVTKN